MKYSFSLRLLAIITAIIGLACAVTPRVIDWIRWKQATRCQCCEIQDIPTDGGLLVSIETLVDGECRDFEWSSLLRLLSTRADEIANITIEEAASCNGVIDDDALNELIKLREIKALYISLRHSPTFHFTRASFARLRELSKLQKLAIHDGSIFTDLDIRCIAKCPSLRELTFSDNQFAPGALRDLADSVQLRCLSFYGCDLTDSDLLAIANISSLRNL